MVGLADDGVTAIEFFIGLSLLALASNSLGLILGCVAPTPLIAVMMSPMCVVPFMICSGFFVNLDDLPVYLWPLRALSPHLYVFTSLFANEFTGQTFHCRDREALQIFVQGDAYYFCYLSTGELVLNIFHIDKETPYGLNMVYTFILFIGYRCVAWAILTLRDRVATHGSHAVSIQEVRKSFRRMLGME